MFIEQKPKTGTPGPFGVKNGYTLESSPKYTPRATRLAKNKSNPSLRDSDPGAPVNGYYAGRYTQGIDEDHPRVSKTRLRYTRTPYNRLLI